MVTVGYSSEDYITLIKHIADLKPYSVSIVDSFGYMTKDDVRRYFDILGMHLQQNVEIGFHSHNNMNLSYAINQDFISYDTKRKLIIDSSLFGMGRGAGNLQTELIANYYNEKLGPKYDTLKMLDMISEFIMPIYRENSWGYSPYFFLTGLYHCHPNYATYLLQEYEVSVTEFRQYLETIPEEMHTKCRKPYVLEMYGRFKQKKALEND